MKNFIIGLVIVGLAITVGFLVLDREPLGANPGPDYYNLQSFHGGLVQGGQVGAVATTGAGILQLTAKQFCDYSVLSVSNNYSASSTTVYLPTGLTAACLQDKGDTKTLFVWNNASDTTSLTVTASTSVTLMTATGTTAVINSTYGTAANKGWASITCVNLDDATTTCAQATIR